MNYDKGIKRKEKKRVQFVKRAKRSGRIGENSLHFQGKVERSKLKGDKVKGKT